MDIGAAKLWLQERRKSYVGAVSSGPRCVAWLIETMEEVLRHIGVEEFVRSTREASNVIIVKRGRQQGRSFSGGGDSR